MRECLCSTEFELIAIVPTQVYSEGGVRDLGYFFVLYSGAAFESVGFPHDHRVSRCYRSSRNE